MKNYIQGHLDSPTDQSKIFTPFLQIRGWAISETNDVSVEILIDDITVKRIKPTLVREDVTKALALNHNIITGFACEVNLDKLDEGIHHIKAIAESNNSKKILGSINVELLTSQFSQHQLELENKFLNRWKECKPDTLLTWGRKLTGDAFVKICEKYASFSSHKSILELGPGYGRILSSLISKNIPFQSYTGVDISSNNIQDLKNSFSLDKINFVQGEFSTIQLKEYFDIVLSSLTLKHQYPTFTDAIKNISKYVKKDGLFIFDLLENKEITPSNVGVDKLIEFGPAFSTWEETGAFVSFYTTEEVSTLLHHLQLELVAFDHVVHWQDTGERLVVVARKQI